jgi:hypothetical protein
MGLRCTERLRQLSSLWRDFLGCGALFFKQLPGYQARWRSGVYVKAPCSGGNVLAHARSGAEEVPEFVVTAAVSSCGWGALEAEHRSTSALDATMILLEAIVEITVCPMAHAAAELHPDRLGIGIVAVRCDPVGDHTGNGLC